jgi:hypothetical protein
LKIGRYLLKKGHKGAFALGDVGGSLLPLLLEKGVDVIDALEPNFEWTIGLLGHAVECCTEELPDGCGYEGVLKEEVIAAPGARAPLVL